MIAGLVLAGGQSRRFGSEKAMAVFEDETLLATAVSYLTRHGLTVAVNAAEGSGADHWTTAMNLPLVSDDPDDPAGPLAGVKAGLLWAERLGAEVMVTSPCDTPKLPPDLITRLLEALGDSDAATARSPSGLQPLCTAWRITPTLARLSAHFAEGQHPAVHDILAELNAAEVVFDSDLDFKNLNTLEDMAKVILERPATPDGEAK